MLYDIIRSPQARRDIRQFARYLKREAGETVARAWLGALEHDIEIILANNPQRILLVR
jgi:plasmid stabilization system protein ParE